MDGYDLLVYSVKRIMCYFIFLKGNNLCRCMTGTLNNKTLGRARDPRANGAWLSKLTEQDAR